MIKNNKQAAATKGKLEELKKGLASFESQEDQMNAVKFKLGIKAFKGLIKDLESQLQTYEELVTQNVNEFIGLHVPDVAKFLISARLARRMSQKELGDKIGVQEQQIQRYEQDDYSKASWSRLMEVYCALTLKVGLEKIVLVKKQEAKILTLPARLTEAAQDAGRKVKRSQHLFFQDQL